MDDLKRSIYIDELEEKMKQLANLREDGKDILVVEFAGVPNSGKTSTIGALNSFFKDHGFCVSVIEESARKCPLQKDEYPFNVWCLCRTLSELLRILKEKDTKEDLLFIDRGLYDTLIWVEYFYEMGKISMELRTRIRDFIMSFLELEDLVIVFNLETEEVIRREQECLLSRKQRTIVNEKTIDQYRSCLKKIGDCSMQSTELQCIDTSKIEQIDKVKYVTDLVIALL